MADTDRYRKSLPLDSFQESGTAEIEGSPLATLRTTGRLEQYAGATLSGYVGENDGTRKLRLLAFRGASLEDAMRCRAKRNPALSEAICRNMLEVGGENAAVLNLLGVLANDASMFDLAVRFFIRSLRADPGYYGACVNLGNLLRDQGLPEEAAVCFRHVLEIVPDLRGRPAGAGAAESRPCSRSDPEQGPAFRRDPGPIGPAGYRLGPVHEKGPGNL